MNKLTLSIDEEVVERAKRYARERGTSVSRVVETMLSLVSRPDGGDAEGARGSVPTPVLSRLRGSLKRGSVADYRSHLRRKHGSRRSTKREGG